MQPCPSSPLLSTGCGGMSGSSLFFPRQHSLSISVAGVLIPDPSAPPLDKDNRRFIFFHDTNYSPKFQTHIIHITHNWSSSLGYPKLPGTLHIQHQIYIFFFSPLKPPPSPLFLISKHWLYCPNQKPRSHPQLLPGLQISYSINYRSLINLPVDFISWVTVYITH